VDGDALDGGAETAVLPFGIENEEKRSHCRYRNQ
jgi:hypothetical protein